MSGADFWNGLLADHAAGQLAAAKVAQALTRDEYRGWSISWEYGRFTAIGPDYDASWEGEEDGWVDNGQRIEARTREDLIEEIDAWIEERSA